MNDFRMCWEFRDLVLFATNSFFDIRWWNIGSIKHQDAETKEFNGQKSFVLQPRFQTLPLLEKLACVLENLIQIKKYWISENSDNQIKGNTYFVAFQSKHESDLLHFLQ